GHLVGTRLFDHHGYAAQLALLFLRVMGFEKPGQHHRLVAAQIDRRRAHAQVAGWLGGPEWARHEKERRANDRGEAPNKRQVNARRRVWLRGAHHQFSGIGLRKASSMRRMSAKSCL